MKKFLLALMFVGLCGLGFLGLKTQAGELALTLEASDDSDGESLFDDDVNTTEEFAAGTKLTFKGGDSMTGLYIKWDLVPTATTLQDGDTELTVGENGFLHEFVELSGDNKEVTLTIPQGGATIADVIAYSGDVPNDVQRWQPSWDKADILFISTHADDEVLFFGGMIPIYTNEDRARVQVAYFTDFFLTENYRNHELLDGLWTMGVDHYPQLGKFYDNYSESLEEAEEQFDHDECLDYIVETIRRFKPQVLVTHDTEGEYGHGGHRYVSKLVREAVDITGDSSKNSASAQEYGTWDVPKTYLHLYPEGTIEMDTRAPLSDFGGKSALDVAKEAYKKHNSQQWMWFYVDDGYDENGQKNDYEYSCAKYGLFRSLVGDDSGTNDVLENITVYDKQTPEVQPEPESEEESIPAPERPAETNKGGSKVLIIVLILVALLVIVFILFFVISRNRRKKQAEMARRERARRAAAARRAAGGQAPQRQAPRQGQQRQAPRSGGQPQRPNSQGAQRPSQRQGSQESQRAAQRPNSQQRPSGNSPAPRRPENSRNSRDGRNR